MPRRLLALAAGLVALSGVSYLLTTLVSHTRLDAPRSKTRALETYGHLPLGFEANRGQTDPRVEFLARGAGYTVFLTQRALVLRVGTARRESVVRAQLVRSNPAAPILGTNRLEEKVNYLLGRDPARWITKVPTYARVTYRGVYPGIDLTYHGAGGRLEQDFVVGRGADPSAIALRFDGVDKLGVDARGDLLLRVPAGPMRLAKPDVYQLVAGERRSVAGRYVLEGRHRVGFRLGAYDRTRPVVIDPVFFYSTYLGGSDDDLARSVAVDSAGNAYVAGITLSADFPTTPLSRGYKGSSDAFVSKLNPTGSGLVYSTYVGGTNSDEAQAIAVDGGGNAYVSGGTLSQDFPTTTGAFQTTYGGGLEDAFVTKLDPTGSTLVYSTYLGGSNQDVGRGIAVDRSGNAYVTGDTSSGNFPTTSAAFQTSARADVNAFVTKLNATGSLAYSTYLGGNSVDGGNAIAVDSSGEAFVTGITKSSDFPTSAGAFQTTYGGGSEDAFVTKLGPTGSTLVYSTYLGGAVDEEGDGIAVDASGAAYTTGLTDSAGFLTTAGAFQPSPAGGVDAYVTKLSPSGSTLVYSTFLGGSLYDQGLAVTVDGSGDAYVTGITQSTSFPTVNAVQGSNGGGVADAFVTQLNPSGGGLVYSTYLGGSGHDEGRGIALDSLPNPNAYVVGFTSSTNYPTTPGAFQTTSPGPGDGFATKITNIVLPPPPTTGKVTGGGSIDVVGGTGTFGFIVQRQTASGPISGDLQYVNHASGAIVHSVAFSSLAIAGNTATFGGTCTNNGAPCTFTVNVTDNGEPGTTDTFTIAVSGGPTDGGVLHSGNIQIHH